MLEETLGSLRGGQGAFRRLLFIVLCALAALALAPTGAAAQDPRGTIQGRVVDASGAAIPGATVEVLNIATGVVTPTTTNDQGSYRAAFLNPGTYRVTVSLAGFGKFISDNIELHVSDLLTVDATLKVGAITDEVTVTATAATVDRTTAELGQVVDARRIAELPIREGSPVELVILAPGVTVVTDLRSRKAAFNNGLSQFSTDGVGEKKNDFTIDGVSNVANDRVAYSPPSASVEEFKIHTTSYDAAIGNTMGAVVNLVTKSGTNALRGQVYEWFRGAIARREELLRPDQQPPEAGLRRQPVRRRDRRTDQVEPDVLLRQRRANPFQVPSPNIVTVPTAKMRSGDFSELLALGPQYQIYNPFTTRPSPTTAGALRPRSVPGQHHPAGDDQPGREEHPRVLPAAEPGRHGRRSAELSEPDRGGVRDVLDGNRPRRSQLLVASTGCTAGSAGTSGKRRRTTGSTTSPPAFSSTARTAFSGSTTPTRSRTTCC